MASIQFGTDGWRAIIGETFTFANVARVAQATADYWTRRTIPGIRKLVIVGFDRRFLSREFGRCTAEVLAGNGFEVVLTSEPTPTPAVSFAVRKARAIGGVMITASHNAPIFNGFKIKTHLGAPADPEICKAVESYIGANPVRSIPLDEGLRSGRIRLADIRPGYFAAIKHLVDFDQIARSELRLAHDALFGVGAGCFDLLLAGTSCRVTTLNAAADPLFGGINPEPIPQNYGRTSAYLRAHPHDLCLVTDGDADRIGGMDGRGHPLSTHQLICLLLYHLYVNRQGRGKVIKALTTTSMVDKMCDVYGLPMVETGVGFKYIAAEMLKGGVLLGAEESGGIGLPGHIPERDGIAAGLMLLEILAMERKSINRLLSQLEKHFGPHHYGRLDVQFPLERRPELMQWLQRKGPTRLGPSPVADMKTYDGVKFIAQDSSWLMLRGSGTEPVLRIYAESPDPLRTGRLLQAGTRLAKKFRTG